MSFLQDVWIKQSDLSQILMSLLKLKWRPLHDITINLSMTYSTALRSQYIFLFTPP